MNQETDYEEVETQVLTRWDKIVQWAGIVKTFFTMGKLVWAFVFATGAAVVVGEATDTSPVRDAAVAVGILGERPRDIIGNDAMYDELMNLIEDVEQLEAQVSTLKKRAAIPGPQGLDGANGKDGTDGKDGQIGVVGPVGPAGPRGVDGPAGRGMDGVSILFDDHVDLLH